MRSRAGTPPRSVRPSCSLTRGRARRPSLAADDFPLGRPGSARNAFYGVPDETTEGVYAAALTPLLRDLSAGAGLGVMRLGSSARHRQLLEGLSPHDIARVAAGRVPSLGVEPLHVVKAVSMLCSVAGGCFDTLKRQLEQKMEQIISIQ